MAGFEQKPLDSLVSDEDWQKSFSAWTGTRRSSLQADGSLRRSADVEAAQLDDARVRALRHCAEVRLRNRSLGERLKEKFRSLQDWDLDEHQQRRHAVEELLALRASASLAADGDDGRLTATSAIWTAGDPATVCSRRLGLRLGQISQMHLTSGELVAPVRVISVDLDGPADKCGIRPGDEILSVDGEPSLFDFPSPSSSTEVARRLIDAMVTDGVAHIRVRRRLPESRETAAPPLPPLDTLPSQRHSAAPAVSDNCDWGLGDTSSDQCAEQLLNRLSLRRQSAPAMSGTIRPAAVSPKLLLATTVEEKEDFNRNGSDKSSARLYMDL